MPKNGKAIPAFSFLTVSNTLSPVTILTIANYAFSFLFDNELKPKHGYNSLIEVIRQLNASFS
ncbi:MAG TPA: hypothetical protein VJ111_18090 [Chitinophagaceae bacterium]|nr:hypothetical protein [Chitinophagaceae bacterium]